MSRLFRGEKRKEKKRWLGVVLVIVFLSVCYHSSLCILFVLFCFFLPTLATSLFKNLTFFP